MNTVSEKLAALRAELKKQGVDGFIIPRSDEYQGEFVAPYAERLKWISGFTGSGGVAAVLPEKAVVLTDGRYLIQVKQQTDAAHFETGNMITDPIEDWLGKHADDDAAVGYDPWLHTPAQIEKLSEKVKNLKPLERNPIDAVWSDQPERPRNPPFDFPENIAGQSRKEKAKLISNQVKKQGADACIITLPDSISWLLNQRGHDIDYIPITLSYLLLDAETAETTIVTPDSDLRHLKEKRVLLDHKRSPIAFKDAIEEAGATLIDAEDPCIAPKAVKSKSEQDAIRKAHILDGVALVKFLHWLENEAPSGQLTEVSAANKLETFRSENLAFKGNSFPAISGFGENGAIIHYRATTETDKTIAGDGLYLLDSGGQYLDEQSGVAGTTDITRTIAIGTPSQEMKHHFTLVLKGHIAVADARFTSTTTGIEIDERARAPLKENNLDYAHGTGHGVGCFLAVHEEATSISFKSDKTFKAGMLISNEPGYYEEGSHGIRIENLIFVHGAGEMCFETVSFAPIDTKLIIADMLSEGEKEWINSYHAKTYEVLSEYLDEQHAAWLAEQTQAL